MGSAPVAMADEVYSSDQYGSRLLAGLKSLQASTLLCDLSLLAENKEVKVHRAVMAAGSDYFRAILTLDMKEKGQDCITLKGIPARGLQAIVEFAYTGQLQCTASNISDVLLTATHLQFTEAIELCSKFLINLTNKFNSVDMYLLAEQFNLVPLQEKALSLVLIHFEDIACTPEFAKISPKFFSKVLADNRLRVTSELKLYQLVLEWVSFDPEARKKVLGEMMSHVRFPLIPPSDMVSVIMKEKLMKADPQCLELILEASKYHMLPDRQPLMQNCRTQIRTDAASIVIFDVDNDGPRVLDLGSRHWGTLEYFNLDTFHAQVCSLDNFMYICGGIELYSSNNPVSGKSYRYDPRFNTWSEISPMLEPRHHFMLISDGDSLFAIGGFCSGAYKSVVEQYNVQKDRWVSRASMDVKLSAAAAAVHQGKVFISGGQTDKGISRCLWSYHIGIDRWYGKASMLHARMDHTMCCYGNSLYVFGGYDKNIIKAYDVDVIESYDVETDQWSVVQEGGPKFSGIYSSLIDSKLYIVGGFSYDNNKKCNEVLSYDIETCEWEVVAKIPSPAMSVPCCTIYLQRNLLCDVTV